MAVFGKYVGDTGRFYSTLDLGPLTNGVVVDFTSLNGGSYPADGRWQSDAGPATYTPPTPPTSYTVPIDHGPLANRPAAAQLANQRYAGTDTSLDYYSDGSTWYTLGSAASLTPTTKTADYTAVPNDFILADSTAGPMTITLPLSPTAGQQVKFLKTDAGSNTVSVAGTVNGDAAGASTNQQWAGGLFTARPGGGWIVEKLYGGGASVPGAPTAVSATINATKATVSFTAPANNGGAAISGYTVTSTPGGLTATGSASPLTVTGLTSGTSYTFTVHATNAVGSGAESSASNSVTAFDPTTVANLSLWLDAADATQVTPASGSLVDGSLVSQWSDKSSGLKHATQATALNQPTYKTGIINARAVLRFDGANSRMATALAMQTTPRTIWVVSTPNGSGAQTFLGPNAAAAYQFRMSALKPDLNKFATTDYAGATNAQITATTHIQSVAYNGTTSIFYVTDGVDNGNSATSQASVTTTGHVGAGFTGSIFADFFNGDIAEIIVVDRLLRPTNTDFDAIEAYLKAKWGTP